MKRQLHFDGEIETQYAKDGTTSRIACVVFFMMGLTTIMVTIRTSFHLFRGRRHLRGDDCCLLLALLFFIGNGVTIWEWLQFKYQPDIYFLISPSYVLIGSFMGTLNSFALGFSKTSLGLTFGRLTSGYWSLIIYVTVFFIDALLMVQAWTYWVDDCYGPDLERPEPYRIQYTVISGCVGFKSVQALRLVVQMLSCGLDAYFTYLPWKIVRTLELKRFEKIGLGIAMSFGAASLCAGTARLASLVELMGATEEHQPAYAVGGYIWNYAEPGLTIIAACIPVLRKVMMDIIRAKKKQPLNLNLNLKFKWPGQHHRKKRGGGAAGGPSDLPVSEFSRFPATPTTMTRERGKSDCSGATYVAVPTPTLSSRSSRECAKTMTGDTVDTMAPPPPPPMPRSRKLRLYYTPPPQEQGHGQEQEKEKEKEQEQQNEPPPTSGPGKLRLYYTPPREQEK